MRCSACRRPLLLFLLLALMLAGCWDRREIEEQNNSLATGWDVCEEGEGCRLIISRQIAIPGRIPLGVAGTTSAGGASMDTVQTVVQPGKDGPDSARKAQAKVGRKLSFGHMRVIVFSEAFARSGMMEEGLDYLRRLPDVRRLGWIAVSEGRAVEIMRARPELERVPALFLSDMIEDAVKTGRLPRVFLSDILIRFSNAGEDAVAPLLRMAGPNRPQIAGLAVFRGYHMVGKLSPEELATYMELRGLRRGGEVLRVQLPEGGRADLRVVGRTARYQVRPVGTRIYVRVKMEMESELLELSPGLTSSDPAVLDRIQRQAAAAVAKRSQALVDKLQHQFGADILAIGEQVRAYWPAVWGSVKDWSDTFAAADFDVEVAVRVRRTGMDLE